MTTPLLKVDNLDISYKTRNGQLKAVSDASFTIDSNEYFGLVGESGCGKSTLAKGLIDGLDTNGAVTNGSIQYKGNEIHDLDTQQFNDKYCWNEIAVIPQSAMNSLNPLSRISDQALEVANTHTDWSSERTLNALKELFSVVGLPESRINDYPHQFSGGMKQRTIIALSLLLEPSLVIADEPTTALDVIMQDQFLKYIDEIRDIRDFSLLFITHDIAVVFEICDSLAVMHGGQIAESGLTTDIFDKPTHPYTILLQQAFPDIRHPDRTLEEIDGSPPALSEEISSCTFTDRCPWVEPDCHSSSPPLKAVTDDSTHYTACFRADEMDALAESYVSNPSRTASNQSDVAYTESHQSNSSTPIPQRDAPVLELQGLHKHFDSSSNIFETLQERLFNRDIPAVRAVDGVDLRLEKNQVQGIIGESGCGKSTLLMTLMGKYAPTSGDMVFNGKSISAFDKTEWKQFRRDVQVIFQDPFNTINPHFTVRDALLEPLRIHDLEQSEERVLEVLEQVQLKPAEEYIDRHESQLSGGEKQRVAIARALILEPEVILADEPVSMLDVSTQASILRLLDELTTAYDVSMLYVSHDLSTVSYICDKINVMYLGRVVESAPTTDILQSPKHPYTEALTQAIPIPDPHHQREWTELPGDPGDARDMPVGCRFKDRCPDRMDICDISPEYIEDGTSSEHSVACHLHYDHQDLEATAEDEVAVDGASQ